MPKSDQIVVKKTEVTLALTELHLRTCAARYAAAVDTQGEDEAYDQLEAAAMQHTAAYMKEHG